MSAWIEWNGGICPVDPETMIEYRLRWFAPDHPPYRCKAGFCRWDHGRTPEAAADPTRRVSDIIQYRVCDSDRLPKGGDSRSEAECEASQSGAERQSPNPSPQ